MNQQVVKFVQVVPLIVAKQTKIVSVLVILDHVVAKLISNGVLPQANRPRVQIPAHAFHQELLAQPMAHVVVATDFSTENTNMIIVSVFLQALVLPPKPPKPLSTVVTLVGQP